MKEKAGTKTGGGEFDEASPALSTGPAFILSVATAFIYFFSNPKPQPYYDYTFRVAGRMLQGGVGFAEKQPAWLNEFVPYGGAWYSVFPLGAVVSMIPAALLKAAGLITEMPGAWISAILAGVICFLLLLTASKYKVSTTRQFLMTAGILFGTFMWTNLTFAGAWQLALGFAMVGELGAIYFTVYDRRPLLAGLFFAIAFGNRTENLLTAPVLMYLMYRDGINRRGAKTPRGKSNISTKIAESPDEQYKAGDSNSSQRLSDSAVAIRRVALFCTVPFVLGIATLTYNYVRFDSFFDFGYARIPGVLEEPWYDHGIFSTHYLGRQAWEMLGKMWEWKSTFPYLVPDGFSSSILFSSPFLIMILRVGSRDGALKLASWCAIFILTFLLWIHGNSGGWQFGYRYAAVLLPWIFVLLLESAPKRITQVEWTLYSLSFIANIYATWLFHWTEYLKVQ